MRRPGTGRTLRGVLRTPLTQPRRPAVARAAAGARGGTKGASASVGWGGETPFGPGRRTESIRRARTSRRDDPCCWRRWRPSTPIFARNSGRRSKRRCRIRRIRTTSEALERCAGAAGGSTTHSSHEVESKCVIRHLRRDADAQPKDERSKLFMALVGGVPPPPPPAPAAAAAAAAAAPAARFALLGALHRLQYLGWVCFVPCCCSTCLVPPLPAPPPRPPRVPMVRLRRLRRRLLLGGARRLEPTLFRNFRGVSSLRLELLRARSARGTTPTSSHLLMWVNASTMSRTMVSILIPVHRGAGPCCALWNSRPPAPRPLLVVSSTSAIRRRTRPWTFSRRRTTSSAAAAGTCRR